MTIDAGSAGQIKSFQFESIATNVPPIKTSSTSKCVNLNADLLDGLTTYDSNWTDQGASIIARDSSRCNKSQGYHCNWYIPRWMGAFPVWNHR